MSFLNALGWALKVTLIGDALPVGMIALIIGTIARNVAKVGHKE